jgi:hypothetical protein
LISERQRRGTRVLPSNEREHHKKRSFEQEFVALLKKAGIDYDPKYVFG